MDVWQRRELLSLQSSPDRTLDYISTLSGTLNLPSLGGCFHLTLRYVPDGEILPPDPFANYLAALENVEWESHEHLATTVLTDVTNSVVPRWVQVISCIENSDRTTSSAAYEILVEDRQPGWDNPSLLARIST